MTTTTVLTLNSRATRTDYRDVIIDGTSHIVTEFGALPLEDQKRVETHANDIREILVAFEQGADTADSVKLDTASQGIDTALALFLPDLDINTTELSDIQKITIIEAILGKLIIPVRA